MNCKTCAKALDEETDLRDECYDCRHKYIESLKALSKVPQTRKQTKKLIKILLSQKKEVREHLFQLKKKRDVISIKMQGLKQIIAAADSNTISMAKEIEIDLGKIMPAEINGLWIVSKNDGKDIELHHFYNLIRNEEVRVKTISLNNFLPRNTVGSDGEEVKFGVGALLAISQSSKTATLLHFANVSPGNPQGEFQYKLALAKLGLGMMPDLKDESFLVIDGGFVRPN